MSNTQASDAQRVAVDLRMQAIIAWAVTALGVVAFHLLHLYAAIGQLAALSDGHGHTHDHDHGDGGGHLDYYEAIADHGSSTTWMMVVFLALMVVPSVIALVSATKPGAIATLAVGVISSLMMVVDGFSHGIGEGAWSTLLLALVAIALPAVVAAIKNLQWLKAVPSASE